MLYQSASTETDYADITAQSRDETVVLYKHSLTCELCEIAKREMQILSQETSLPVYEVVVQTARPLSNHIEAALSVRHESPQVIVLQGGDVIFHASHLGVTADKVRAALPAPA